MADVNGDRILDLVVGTGKGVSPQVVAYDGNDTNDGVFKTELTRFAPFDADFTGGVTVAGADIDGNALADNIIVGLGAGDGVADQGVLVHAAERVGQGARRVLRVHAVPRLRVGGDAGDRHGRDRAPGRESIVTAPGAGEAPLIKTFRYDLYEPTARARANGTATQEHSTASRPIRG